MWRGLRNACGRRDLQGGAGGTTGRGQGSSRVSAYVYISVA